jgi:hypothetical protein
MEKSLRSSASGIVTLSDLKQHRDAALRSSAVVNDSSESQINRYDYLRGPKEIDEKLMCSENPTAGTRPAIYASEAWSSDLNVEELKVKSNRIGPNYMS